MSREDRNEMLRARMREAAEYIEDMPRFSSKNTPEVTKAYLRLLGEPDRDMKIIHVAGTNGKGSVCGAWPAGRACPILPILNSFF